MDVKVSIIIPLYNTDPELYLRKCLVSLVNQDLDNYEIVIINNGSTDNSLAVCEEFKKKYDFIRIYSQDNKGADRARIRGITLARGKYIVFVDCDDTIELNFCSKMYEAIEKHNVDVVICDTVNVYKYDIQVHGKKNKRELYEGRVLSRAEILTAHTTGALNNAVWDKMYRKSVLNSENILSLEGFFCGDEVFNCQVYKNSSSFYLLPDALYYHIGDRGFNVSASAIYYWPKRILDTFIQYSGAIECFYEAGTGVIDSRYIKMFTNSYKNVLINAYRGYQYTIFCALVLSETLYNKDNCYCLFGASSGAEKYMAKIHRKVDNLFFVDNDKNKQGKQYMGYDIFGPEILNEKSGCKVFFTSMYVMEIIEQLMSFGIIRAYTEVMPYLGETETERAFAEGFQYLFNALKKVGDL